MAPQSDLSRAALEALSEIALAVNSIQEPDVLLGKALEIAIATLQAERGLILLETNRETNRRLEGFEVKGHCNFTHEKFGTAHISTRVAREVLRHGEPLLLNEALQDERFGSTESVAVEHIQSIACVPLQLKERQIGAIYLDSLTRPACFTSDSLPFLVAFANQVAISIENVRLYETLREKNHRPQPEFQRIYRLGEMVGQSPQLRKVFETLAPVIRSDATVLIEGESGTGKELIARALHNRGKRADQPFVAIFCGSLPETLLESELFGHKKGAFTGATSDKKGLFETANGGTVFLDEVGDLSPRLQQALLRVLQEGEIKRVGENLVRSINVRVVSATHKPLKDMVQAREFREDLYYRLNTITISVPPLRHRHGDVPLLAHHFLTKYAVGTRDHIKGFTPAAMEALQAYPWPGNVRELSNAIERAVVLAQGTLITTEDLRLPDHQPIDPFEPGITLKEAERRLVTRALKDQEGNISETARLLGVSRRWLHYKLKEWESSEYR